MARLVYVRRVMVKIRKNYRFSGDVVRMLSALLAVDRAAPGSVDGPHSTENEPLTETAYLEWLIEREYARRVGRGEGGE